MVLHCHTAATDCWFYTVTLLQQTAGSTLLHCCNRLLVLHCHTARQNNELLVLHCHTTATDCWFFTVTLLLRTAGSTLSHCGNGLLDYTLRSKESGWAGNNREDQKAEDIIAITESRQLKRIEVNGETDTADPQKEESERKRTR